MGGYGSTRWGLHYKKTAVEDCQRLAIDQVKGGAKYGRLESVRIQYTFTDWRTGEAAFEDYPIPITWTPTPWGARRYWFSCPECGKRARALYLPPGRRYYACRNCHNLTYRSRQESRKQDSGIYRQLAAGMQDVYPGMTARDVYYLFEQAGQDKPPAGGYFEREATTRLAELQALIDGYNPYADYLTRAELCERSGLSADSLAGLESARLLLPDHEGKYRPKLAGWGRKLATLLGEGWNLDELKAWARGRWSTPDPRRFPPERADWSGKNV